MIKQAKNQYELCEALKDISCDVQPDHNPNPGWIMDGGASCVECGGFVPNDGI